MVSDKIIKRKINEMYLDLADAYVDTYERVSRNKISLDEGVKILTAVLDRTVNDYDKLKSENKQAEDLFIESDKKMKKLFGDVKGLAERYSDSLTTRN